MICDILSIDSSPQSNGQPEYRLSPNVLIVVIDDGTSRLLDLDGTFSALPPVTTEMLVGILNAALESVVGQVAARYGADPAHVRADLDRLADDLVQQGVIRRGDSAVPRKRVRQRVLSAALPALVRAVTAAPLNIQLRAKVLLGVAHVAIQWFGWPATVAASPVPFGPPGQSGDSDLIRSIDEAVRSAASRHLLNVACKERSLVCWWLLRVADVPARMVIGITLYPFGCHCWCEAGGRVLTDFADRCERFFPVTSYS